MCPNRAHNAGQIEHTADGGGERIAAGIVTLAESLKNELLMRELFTSRNEQSSNQELTEQLDELNRTLKELTSVLKQRS